MESKIPKPSVLKKPTQITKFDFNLVSQRFKDEMTKKPELQKSLSEFKFTRSKSPDIGATKVVHSKLRRSKSATDLMASRAQAQPSLKRFQPTLDPIPSKRVKPSNTLVNRPALGAKMPAVLNKENTSKSTITRKPISKPATKPIIANKSSSSSASSKPAATITASSKNIATKHIPKYDYKARFYNLEEKFKALKEKYENAVEDVNKYEHMSEENERQKAEIAELTTENTSLKQVVDENATKINNLQLKVQALSGSLKSTTEELTTTKDTLEKTESELFELQEKHTKLVEKTSTLETDYESIKEMFSAAQTQLYSINVERKVLHNQVMDLKGNIRVYARVRPTISESESNVCNWYFTDEGTMEVQCQEKRQGFTFDCIFTPNSLQQEIFDTVAPLIQSALDGYNVCIFAYGQTGSGKTYTMDGAFQQPGIIPRTTQLLFNSVKDAKVLGWSYEIKASFLEIYNEVLYDLLCPETTNIEIRMANATAKNEIIVSNLSEVTVESPEQLHQLMETARRNRATAATVGNERSSRSHAVTRIHLKGTHETSPENLFGQINLVDLAGSESPKTSTNMDETKNINRSLSELSNVILALVQRNEHVPYRNSKLTHLLMPSLGGNSKTLMFVNVSPTQDCYQETIKSLRFAANVNSCKMQKARRNKQLNVSSAF